MEAEYIVACEAAKELVWLKKFYTDLEVVKQLNYSLITRVQFHIFSGIILELIN